jgi:hypothetical protein
VLSNGDLGGADPNFLIMGHDRRGRERQRAMRGRGRELGGRLVRIGGVTVAAGVFVMDPADGFPAGTRPACCGAHWLATGHMAAGTVSFAALIAACSCSGTISRSANANAPS